MPEENTGLAEEPQEGSALPETEVETSEGTGEKAPETEVKPEEDYSRKVQARIDKLTREKYEEKIKREKLEVELLKFKEQTGSRPPRPNIKQYTDDYGNIDPKYDTDMASYEDSLLDWRDSQREINEIKQRTQVGQDTVLERFNSEAEALRVKYPDFDATIENPVYGPPLRAALLENGLVEEAYYLGKNEKEATRLSKMAPYQMMMELGRLKEKIVSLAGKTSKAPPPISPVEGEEVDLTTEPKSDQEWFAREEKRRLENLKKKMG